MKQAVLILAAALAFALPSQAADSPAERAAYALVPLLGSWIASQGNAALVEIREELNKDLLKRLKPYLPANDTPSHAAASGAQF